MLLGETQVLEGVLMQLVTLQFHTEALNTAQFQLDSLFGHSLIKLSDSVVIASLLWYDSFLFLLCLFLSELLGVLKCLDWGIGKLSNGRLFL